MLQQRIGKSSAFVAALIAFLVYVLTMTRTVTWLHNGADSGELVTAAFTFGIPHPPGYPLYTMLAAVFARVPLGEPAFGVALLSALAAASAVFVLARAGSHLTPQPPSLKGKGEKLPSPFRRGVGWVGAPRGIVPQPDEKLPSKRRGVGWVGAPRGIVPQPDEKLPSPFRRGVGGEVFIPPLAALGFAFAPLLWSQATIPEVYTLNLFFVALILWACLSNHPQRVKIAALALGLGMTHHLSIVLLAPGAWLLLQPQRQDARALLWLVAPLLVYAYLPIAALANPPVKWGNPITPERFFWLVSAAQYRQYWFGLSGADILTRAMFSARALVDQFTFVGLALMVWGAIQLAMTRTRIFVALWLMFVPMVAYALVYASRDAFIYLLPAFAIALLWLMYGAVCIVQMLGDDRLLVGAAIALFTLFPIFNLVTNHAAMDISRDRAAYEYARMNLAPLPADAILFADGDEALFALLYYRHAVAYQNARSVIVSQGLLQYDWYYDSLRRLVSEVQFKPPGEVTDAPQRAHEIIRVTFAEGRAVCFSDSSPLLPEFEYEERGVVKCVVAEK
ncbi:MAG: DUF2723 domain-containing protein [Chloroflexi bacterium]|nr:DUF2723 domain-containing protein [Chloroflexota bacterium]